MVGAKTWAMVPHATGDPISVVMSSAKPCMSAWMAWDTLVRISARSVGAIRGHGPLSKASRASGHGLVDVRLGGVRDAADDLFGRRVDHVDGAGPRRAHPFTTDEQPVVDLHVPSSKVKPVSPMLSTCPGVRQRRPAGATGRRAPGPGLGGSGSGGDGPLVGPWPGRRSGGPVTGGRRADGGEDQVHARGAGWPTTAVIVSSVTKPPRTAAVRRGDDSCDGSTPSTVLREPAQVGRHEAVERRPGG